MDFVFIVFLYPLVLLLKLMYHSLKLTIYIIIVIMHVYTTQVTKSAFSVCWLANLLFAFILMNNNCLLTTLIMQTQSLRMNFLT